MDTDTILITEPIGEPQTSEHPVKVAIYTRVSAAENQDNLEGQANRLRDYCAAKGYPVAWVVKEIGSGVNDTRPKLLKLLTDPAVRVIVVVHKDRLTRFGFEYLQILFLTCGVRLTVLDASEETTPEKELSDDLIAIITSFSGRLYGLRSPKQKELVKCARQMSRS